MSNLLPSNATPEERAMAETTARISDVPVVVREVWNADTSPSNILPWLAWAFSVDDWDTEWTESQKREVIKKSVYTQRTKGTIGAVRQQLAAIGLDIKIYEWFDMLPAGAPYTFEVFITTVQSPLTEEQLKRINSIIETNKNLRSHMVKQQIISRSLVNPSVAIVPKIGSDIRLFNYTRAVGALNDFVMPQANISTGE